MCLGLPGKIVDVAEPDAIGMRFGRVDFGGAVREVCLTCTPDAGVGDYVLVHAGFSISRLEEKDAREIFDYLKEIDPEGEEAAALRDGSRAEGGG
jgi:hydrogenase expression/formation protein HypC